MSLTIILIYLITGFLAGIFSGLLGIGGGIIVVPALSILLSYQYPDNAHIMHIATSTSLMVVIFSTSMSAFSQYRRKAINLEVARMFIPGMALGILLGVLSASHLSSSILKIIFGLFTGLFALHLFRNKAANTSAKKTFHPLIQVLVAALVGFLAGLLGIGGGVIVIPVMLMQGLPIVQASATSSLCTLPTVVVGTIAAMLLGGQMPQLPGYYIGYVNVIVACLLGVASLFGAPIGVHFAHKLPVLILRRIFSFVLMIIALKMLGDNFL